MRRHIAVLQVQEQACAALWHLCGVCEDVRERVVASGGIELVIGAIQNHSAATSLLVQAFVALSTLCQNATAQLLAEKAGASRAVKILRACKFLMTCAIAIGCHRDGRQT